MAMTIPEDEAAARVTAGARRRLLVVRNREAGVERRRIVSKVCRALAARGAELTIVDAGSAEEDRRIAAAAVGSGAYDAVVAAGGDSTVRGVARGLMNSALPLGVIPAGTGNVLAGEIGCTRRVDALVDQLMYGPSTPVAAGLANGEPFLLMASAGFDARVLERLNLGWKRRLGKLAYVWPVARELMQVPPLFEACIDGRTYRCAWLIVTRSSRYAGAFRLVRTGLLQSRQCQAVVVKAEGRLALLSVLLAIAAGRAERHPLVEVLPCRKAEVSDAERVGAQVDGEPLACRTLAVASAEDELNLILPRRP